MKKNEHLNSDNFFLFSFSVLKRSVFFMLITALSASIAAFILTRNMPKRYSSSATILFINGGSGFSFGMGGASFSGGSGGGIDGKLIKQILESRILREAVVKKLNLTEHFKKRFVDTVHKLRSKVKITYYEYKKILIITSYMDNPELAANVINCYIESLEEINRKLELSTDKKLVTVLDPPLVPSRSSGPFAKKNMISAFFIGLFMSYILAFCFFFIYNHFLLKTNSNHKEKSPQPTRKTLLKLKN